MAQTVTPKRIAVNGTFDIIHPGHLSLLNFAKSLGDFLLVAIDTDERVKLLKGHTRPINTEHERKLLLSNLKAVDEVRLFGTEQELCDIFEEYQPDILVIGSDYKGQRIVGESSCKKIVFYDRIEKYSTTEKISDIIARR